MPLRIPDGLPAKNTLHNERIFALEEEVAEKQDIRPLELVILNLMPTKIETETQILRLISKSPIQVKIEFMRVSSHAAKNTSAEHLGKFYETFDHFRDKNYDGCIITGAPVEQLEYEDVDYWNELCEIMDWADNHVFSTMYLCWGAMAALYHFYGVLKYMMHNKLFGVFPNRLVDEYEFLTNGFDELHNIPHSRHATINEEDLAKQPKLKVLSESSITGPSIIAHLGYREIFVTGHMEYGRETLSDEYFRDVNLGKPIKTPVNYFPNDDPANQPIFTWRSHANLLYRNWINWIYQMTPYDFAEIPNAIQNIESAINKF